jgi:hypothetical protein
MCTCHGCNIHSCFGEGNGVRGLNGKSVRVRPIEWKIGLIFADESRELSVVRQITIQPITIHP